MPVQVALESPFISTASSLQSQTNLSVFIFSRNFNGPSSIPRVRIAASVPKRSPTPGNLDATIEGGSSEAVLAPRCFWLRRWRVKGGRSLINGNSSRSASLWLLFNGKIARWNIHAAINRRLSRTGWGCRRLRARLARDLDFGNPDEHDRCRTSSSLVRVLFNGNLLPGGAVDFRRRIDERSVVFRASLRIYFGG